MKIIEPSVEIIKGETPLKHLELCGRVCYKSENHIADGTDERFIANIIRSGHEAVLEHFNFCFEVSPKVKTILAIEDSTNARLNPGYHSFLRWTDRVVSGNVRAWRTFLINSAENYGDLPFFLKDFVQSNPVLFPELQELRFSRWSWVRAKKATMRLMSDDELKTEAEILTHRCVTLKFICDRGVSHEIVRHRTASFCQESTRYCNYQGFVFGNEITVIKPCYLEKGTYAYITWENACDDAEIAYFELLDDKKSPQEARAVLPNSLKTEVVMTAPVWVWKHFFELRCSHAAHPQMREVALMARPLVLEEVGIND